MDLSKFIFQTIPCKLLGVSRSKYESEQPTVKILVRQHGCAGWPDSKLVPKPSTIRSKHKLYLHILV